MLVCFPHLYQQDGRDSSSLDCKLGNGLTFAVRICFTGGGVTHFLPNSHDRTCSPWFLILDADGFFTLCGAFRMRVGDVESSVSPATFLSVNHSVQLLISIKTGASLGVSKLTW